jgi:hypothetical protein
MLSLVKLLKQNPSSPNSMVFDFGSDACSVSCIWFDSLGDGSQAITGYSISVYLLPALTGMCITIKFTSAFVNLSKRFIAYGKAD